VARRRVQDQDHGLEQALDHKILGQVHSTLETLSPIEVKLPVRNIHRSVGTMLSGEIARRYGSAGLPDDTVHIQLSGSAGQSMGAFLAKGVTLTLEGEANDYVGKGQSGGKIIVYPPRGSRKISLSAMSCSTERPVGKPSSTEWRASALRFAIPERPLLLKALAITAVST
jgi:glutamate synthase domain-containing protein 3